MGSVDYQRAEDVYYSYATHISPFVHAPEGWWFREVPPVPVSLKESTPSFLSPAFPHFINYLHSFPPWSQVLKHYSAFAKLESCFSSLHVSEHISLRNIRSLDGSERNHPAMTALVNGGTPVTDDSSTKDFSSSVGNSQAKTMVTGNKAEGSRKQANVSNDLSARYAISQLSFLKTQSTRITWQCPPTTILACTHHLIALLRFCRLFPLSDITHAHMLTWIFAAQASCSSEGLDLRNEPNHAKIYHFNSTQWQHIAGQIS